MTFSIQEIKEKTYVKRGDLLYSLVDYLAYYPAKIFLFTNITANQVTVIWIIGQILSSCISIFGTKKSIFLSVLLFQLFFVLDCTDGIMARFRKQQSNLGVYLDYVGHYVANPLMFIMLGIGCARYTSDLIYIVIGIACAFFFLLNKAITLNPLWYSEKSRHNFMNFSIKSQHISSWKKVVYMVLRIEYLFNFLFWASLLGFPHYSLWVYLVALPGDLILKFYRQLRKNTEIV